jgi:hypothetical protein
MNPIIEQDIQTIKEVTDKEDNEKVETAKEGPDLKCYFSNWLFEVHTQIIPHQELTDEEILTLAEKAGTFDFYYDPEEDIYSPSDGTPI